MTGAAEPGRAPRTVVHMLRHGQVENPGKVLYGWLPGFPLSALGERMAARVAQALSGKDVTHIASSPLERAAQTAQSVADEFGLAVRTDERLIEATNAFQGRRVTGPDGIFRDPRAWWTLRDPFAPSWGERYATIADRMHAALMDALAAAAGHEAVCVSHELPIWTLRRLLERRRLWHHPARRQCALASLTSFHFEGTELVGIGYSEPAADLLRAVG
jgi:broad specificity phosphatase PhoE